MVKTSELSDSLGEPINVLGWYHSHPHITVQPSHVDLRTQASYQMMDNRFIGVIFSVFNVDKTKVIISILLLLISFNVHCLNQNILIVK